MKETAYTGTRVLTSTQKSLQSSKERKASWNSKPDYKMWLIPCPFHRNRRIRTLTYSYLRHHFPSVLSLLWLLRMRVCCSNRGIPSASHRHYTALKAWRPTMPQVQVGVALTYLSNTAIIRSRAFVLYPHHPIFLEVSFSLWMLSMHHRSSTSKKHFITT